MLLVCMNWICTEYAIDARLVLTIHDEVANIDRNFVLKDFFAITRHVLGPLFGA